MCYYLQNQRKVVADDTAQVLMERYKTGYKMLKAYRKILRELVEKEKEIYEYLNGIISSDICWKRLVNEETDSSSSEANTNVKDDAKIKDN